MEERLVEKETYEGAKSGGRGEGEGAKEGVEAVTEARWAKLDGKGE